MRDLLGLFGYIKDAGTILICYFGQIAIMASEFVFQTNKLRHNPRPAGARRQPRRAGGRGENLPSNSATGPSSDSR